MLALEFKQLGEISPSGSYLLNSIYKILIITVAFQIVRIIGGYFLLQQMISLFESINFETITIFQLECLMSEMDTMGLGSEFLGLIPTILELFAFYKFDEWVNVMTCQYSYHGGTKDLHKTSN